MESQNKLAEYRKGNRKNNFNRGKNLNSLKSATIEKSILLCKLALEIDAASAKPLENEQNQLTIFQWNDKQWRTLFPIPYDTLKIALSLKKSFRNVLYIEAIAGNNLAETFLAVFYKGYENLPERIRLSQEEQMLLSNIFVNYPNSIRQQVNCSASNSMEIGAEVNSATDGKRNLIQEYVTSALYDALYQKHLDCKPSTEQALPTLPEFFRPTLCGYQERAVHWLLQRELEVSYCPNFYTELQAKDGETTVYKNLLSWHFEYSKPSKIELAPGGILADEMGLGKTVEVLALIVLNPRQISLDAQLAKNEFSDESLIKRPRRTNDLFCICSHKLKSELRQCSRCALQQHVKCVSRFDKKKEDDSDYLCPSCWYSATKEAPLPAATTFIVTPRNIKPQWLYEIQKHLGPSLKVFDYNELALDNWISPVQLASYDIVLTEYSVLRREVYHTSAYLSERVTRNEQRSMRRMSPLLMVEWWRVCLDEAQMVESNSSVLTALVRQLPAINRWAITGTPIQRIIDDVRGLLEFIGFREPLVPINWNGLVDDFVLQQNNADQCEPHQLTLVDVLQCCMWRSCKSKVYKELQLPPQTEQVHRLRLSNLEKLFYSEQHALCESSFNNILQKYLGRTDEMLKISPRIMNIILQPLLKIRQCCITPVVNTSNKGPYKNSANVQQKQFLQPKDLLAHLKSTNELECKSELRSVASSYNGMAAIYFIKGNFEQAIKNYEMVLRLAREYKDINITVDSLLQIHALYNIQQAFYIAPPKTIQMSADLISKYDEECNALEWKYLEPYVCSMHAKRTSCSNALEMLARLELSAESPLLEFISLLVDETASQSQEFVITLLNRFHDEFATSFGGSSKMEQLKSLSGMLYVLVTWYKKVDAAQKHLNVEFENLKFYTMNVYTRAKNTPAIWREMYKFIRIVYECHLSEILEDKKGKKKSKRKSKNSKKDLCKLCQIRNALNKYECLLFNKVIDEDTNMTEGLRNHSFEIGLIKVLFAYLRTKPAFLSHSEQMEKHWESIECRQQLCKKLIKYWIEIEYTVKVYDELDMCKMRISLAENDEDKTHFKLLDYELDNTFMEQQMNLHEAQRRFAMKLARLKYITHLEADAAPGPCPICQSEDESRYAVLECGHHLCLLCLRTIQPGNSSNKLCCPICRNRQNSKKFYYVTCNATTPTEIPIQVVGDFSSKITYIVRLILQLKRDHAKDMQQLKILVFSKWSEILPTIANALKQNGIRHRINYTPRAIEEFKNPLLGVTCLLMALRKGCNGLNLIEATHVFLVEPILNPGEEAQAIGRVHRFGQTRPTTVHRFIVCNTIEENIFNVVNTGKQSQTNWEFKQISVESLRNLFHLENDVSEEYISNSDEPVDVT